MVEGFYFMLYSMSWAFGRGSSGAFEDVFLVVLDCLLALADAADAAPDNFLLGGIVSLFIRR